MSIFAECLLKTKPSTVSVISTRTRVGAPKPAEYHTTFGQQAGAQQYHVRHPESRSGFVMAPFPHMRYAGITINCGEPVIFLGKLYDMKGLNKWQRY